MKHFILQKDITLRIRSFSLCISAFFLMLLCSCSPLSGYRELMNTDIHPPVILGAETSSENCFLFEFSEQIVPVQNSFRFLPPTSIEKITIRSVSESSERKELLCIYTENSIPPGSRCLVEGEVMDPSGNTLFFSAAVYGWNDTIPKLVINEFTTQGSAAHPDRVELIALSAGSTAGITFCDGVNFDRNQRIIFPPIEVMEGDIIVIHCGKETGSSLSETLSTSESLSKYASDSAWDIWIESGKGLSGNNGIISLYTSPQGELMDAVLYSNRDSSSDSNYKGFGSRALLDRVVVLADQGGWKSAGFDIFPEDGINPDDSTATRSMCRISPYTDTDSREDWYIVPTSKSTFGEANFEGVYIPSE
ncbi:MAG: hypothetical protein HQ557_00660 [Bacteroidetes bacterium]|nr:hypothetical protein [Bacteroidota bacterium]